MYTKIFKLLLDSDIIFWIAMQKFTLIIGLDWIVSLGRFLLTELFGSFEVIF